MANRKNKFVRVLRAIPMICACACVVLIFVAAVYGKKKNTPVYLFGVSVFRVETGSMQPEIKPESYILVRKYHGEDLRVGQIFTYLMTDESSDAYGLLITHRVVEVTENGYTAKGDFVDDPDELPVQKENIEATFLKKLPLLTFFSKAYASPIGLIALIGTFVFACAFVYVPEIASVLAEDKKKAEKEKLIEERVREELQKMLNAEKSQNRNGGEKNVDDVGIKGSDEPPDKATNEPKNETVKRERNGEKSEKVTRE